MGQDWPSPPGRQLQVNRAMKRFLSSDYPGLAGTGSSDDQDEVLPLFGESGSEYDEDTCREIEDEEEEEQRRTVAEKAEILGREEVDRTVDAAIQSLQDQWARRKKPTWDRKAYSIWDQHRRGRTRQLALVRSSRRLQALNDRVAKIDLEIRSQEWRSEDELRRQTLSLELSVSAREHQRWFFALLNNPAKPPRPRPLPKPELPANVPRAEEETDEEILPSESEDGLDDFIVEDEPMDLDKPIDLNIPIAGSLEQERDAAPQEAPNPNVDSSIGRSPERTSSPSLSDPQPAPLGSVALPLLQSPGSESCDYDLSQLEDPATPTAPDDTSNSPSRSISQQRPFLDVVANAGSQPVKPVSPIRSLSDITEMGPEHCGLAEDPEQLVVIVLHRWAGPERDILLACVEKNSEDDLWKHLIERAMMKREVRVDGEGQGTREDQIDRVALMLARLFDVYISCSLDRAQDTTRLRPNTVKRIGRQSSSFGRFCHVLKPAAERFPSDHVRHIPEWIGFSNETPGTCAGRPISAGHPANGDELPVSGDDAQTGSSDSEVCLPHPPANRRGVRKVVRDKGAEDLRQSNRRQKEEYEERRILLHQQLATSGSVPEEARRIIINAGKRTDQELVYVHRHIAARIKPHQVSGVEFMWREVVVQKKGCLLAHTMGLGKTMQVITLLVAIAEASRSDNGSISSQVPEHLKESKTLVMCPSGVVNNWLDELLLWVARDAATDGSLLGAFFRVHADQGEAERQRTVRKWADEGGVLIAGYSMFSKLCEDENTAQLLWEEPNIVVADEAHMFKNINSAIHNNTKHFRTQSRIAMTGTPLANNVSDYYAMIDWAHHNFLGPHQEFVATYETPIKQGLYSDSKGSEKRKALKVLSVLKNVVEPKVHRMSISVLRGQLPAKKEFIIYLWLTEAQMTAYKSYISHVRSMPSLQASGQAKVWSFVAMLSGLLAHPYVFRSMLQKRKGASAASARGCASPRLDEAGERAGNMGEDGDGTGKFDLPETALSDVLATVSSRSIGDYALSWKVVVLMRILDEAKKIGDKVLVFSHLLTTLDYLQETFRVQKRNFSRLDGSTPVFERQRLTKNFNTSDGADVYLISTRAGGVGLNIYGANRVVIFDFKFVPAEEQQAVGRAFRLGQKKPVYVYWLVQAGTYETVIQNRSVFKAQLASRVVDKKNPVAWSKRQGDYFAEPSMPRKAGDLGAFRGEDAILDALLESSDLARGLQSILATDTFEEEEPDEGLLTKEDRDEVSSMIAQSMQRQMGQPNLSPTTPQPHMAGEPAQPIAGTPSLKVTPASQPAATPPPTATIPDDVPAVAMSGGSGSRTATRGPNPKTLRPMEPVAGTGTQIRNRNISGLRQAGAAAELFPRPLLGLESRKALLVESLRRARDTLAAGGAEALLGPTEAAKDIVAALEERSGLVGLPLLDRWKTLLEAVGHPRTGQALVCGHLQPQGLSGMDSKQLGETAAQLDSMTEAEYQTMLRDRKDPSHGHADARGPAPRPGSAADETATGDASPRRTSRTASRTPDGQGHFPDWAQRQPTQERSRKREGGSPRPGDSADLPHVID